MSDRLTLSSQQRQILYYLQFDAHQTAEMISKKTLSSAHAVRHQRRRLLREEIIEKPEPLINFFQLGFSEYRLSLSLRSSSNSTFASLAKFIRECPQIAWALKTGGDDNCVLGICVNKLLELEHVVSQINCLSGDLLIAKNIDIRKSFARFPLKFLTGETSNNKYIGYDSTPSVEETGKAPLELLSALTGKNCHSLSELSEYVGVPVSTVQAQLKRLEQKGIIEHYFYPVHTERLGVQSFFLNIATRGFTKQMRDQLFEYALKSSQVVSFSEWLGAWDFTLGVVISNPLELLQIEKSINDSWGPCISDLRHFWIYQKLKKPGFIFTNSYKASPP